MSATSTPSSAHADDGELSRRDAAAEVARLDVAAFDAVIPPRSSGPSLQARVVRKGFELSLRALRGRSGGSPLMDASEEQLREFALGMRAQLDELGKLPVSRYLVSTRPEGLDGLWVTDRRTGPDDAASADRVVLHLHGGAYVMGSPETHRGLALALSRTARGPVLLPRYRLAPEHPFPAAVEDAIAAYRWLLDQGVPAERVAVSGDSAGGGLALALLLSLDDEGLPRPAAYVGFSPWTDLAATGVSLHERDTRDPWLSGDLVLPAAQAYAGDTPLDDPGVSPLYGDLSGLPPSLVHVGSEEILFDDAARLVMRAREAGVDASLGRFDGMWHVFQAFPLPEARWSLREAGAFIRRHTSARLLAGHDSSREAPAG